MKLLLSILLLASPVLADITPAPCVGFDCNVERPEEPTDIAPMPPVINQLTCPDNGWFQLGNTCYPFTFSSHLEAEQHWYHCALGIVIWGDLIKQAIPEFQAVEIRDLIAPVVPFQCDGFELYEQSNLCSKFQDQREAEANYQACTLTNFQYWDLLTVIRNTPKPTPPSACKRFGGQNIWKVNSETRPTTVMLLDRSYCFADTSIKQDMRPLNIWLEDISGNRISNGSFRHCNTANDNRLHYDFPKGSGEAVVQILFEDDTTECFYVPERSRDQR
jgi:hypothetical protein